MEVADGTPLAAERIAALLVECALENHGSVRMTRYRTPILVSAALAGLAWAAGCGDGVTEPPLPPSDPPRPTTVVVSPATAQLTALGATVQLTADVRDQNGQVMSGASVTWSSSATAVATVSSTGLVTAASDGTATITATAGSVAGTVTVTVVQEVGAVVVSPAVDTLVTGDTLRLAANATDANGHAVPGAEFVWMSRDTSVAIVDGIGLVMAVAPGDVEVAATAGAASGSAWITVPNRLVALVVTKQAPLTAIGETIRLLVTAHWEDGSQRVIDNGTVEWQSSDPAVATVVDGAVVAAGGGHATIRATYEEQMAEAPISVHISLRQTKTVRVLYAAPADREFRDDYRERIQYAIVDLQSWYRQQLGGLTFSLYDATPELCRMSENHDFYARGDAWSKVLGKV